MHEQSSIGRGAACRADGCADSALRPLVVATAPGPGRCAGARAVLTPLGNCLGYSLPRCCEMWNFAPLMCQTFWLCLVFLNPWSRTVLMLDSTFNLPVRFSFLQTKNHVIMHSICNLFEGSNLSFRSSKYEWTVWR